MADAAPDRLDGLDLIRGLAVMGIALMNVASFALPPAAYDDPVAFGPASAADIVVWLVEFVLIDGKLRALFSILFGASFVLMTDRAAARGGHPLSLHLRRMAVLFLIGLGHALLIWPGDILVMYALAGTAACLMRDKPIPALLVAAGLCLVAQGLISLLIVDSLRAMHAAADQADWTRYMLQICGAGGDTPCEAVTLHRGPYAPLLAQRLSEARAVRIEQLVAAGPETLGLMLIGMAGLRSGALAGRWPRRRYVRIAAATTLAGTAAGLLLALVCLRSHFAFVPVYAAATLGGAPLRPAMALGYAAAALAVRQGGIAARIRAIGRMALSSYIGTSLLFALLFDGYGLGLYARLSRTELLLPVLGAWALMLLLCPLWLGSFRQGPLEWLWRSLASGTRQPLRRRFTIET